MSAFAIEHVDQSPRSCTTTERSCQATSCEAEAGPRQQWEFPLDSSIATISPIGPARLVSALCSRAPSGTPSPKLDEHLPHRSAAGVYLNRAFQTTRASQKS